MYTYIDIRYTLESRSDQKMVRVIKSFFILTVKYDTKNIVQQYSTVLTLSFHFSSDVSVS